MNRHKTHALAGTIATMMGLTALAPRAALAQSDSTAAKPSAPAPAPAAPAPAKSAPNPAAPPFKFSGTLFANYQYHTDPATRNQNKFDLERAYLTFMAPAGDRASVRVTADVFQQTAPGNDGYYKGWVVRAKYAYLQYDFLKTAEWSAVARGGIVHTAVIDHEENFWPRWIGLTPFERAGYFSSADAGLATIVTLPGKLGEFYGSIVNGPGYASRETDRFKDLNARITLTPLSTSGIPILHTLDLSLWAYRGATASKFASGGAGQVGAVGQGLTRDRWGVFAGVRDPRLTAAIDYGQRTDGYESGANTPLSPRTVADSSGRLLSAYAVAKPFELPLGVIARYDRVTPNTGSTAGYDVVIAGLSWDITNKAAFSIDYQEQTPRSGFGITPTRTWFAHWVANF